MYYSPPTDKIKCYSEAEKLYLIVEYIYSAVPVAYIYTSGNMKETFANGASFLTL